MIGLPAKCGNSSHVNHSFSDIFLHSSILLELPCSLFAIWCIANVTSKQMYLLKVLLLVHQIWVSYYSFLFNVAMSPVIFFPDIVIYTRGFLDILDVPITLQTYLINTAFAGMMLSILGLFAYRHQCVLPDGHFLKMRQNTFVIFSWSLHILAFFYGVPQILWRPDQEASLEKMQLGYADPPCDLWDPHIYIFFYGFSKLLIIYGISVGCCSNMMMFYIWHSFRTIRKRGSVTSKSTRKKQIGFLYALILMAVIPNLLLCFPIVGLIVCTASSVAYNPAFGEILVCCLSVHGLASTVTLILSVKPYKQAAARFLKKWILREFGKRAQEPVQSSVNPSKTLYKSRPAPNPTSSS